MASLFSCAMISVVTVVGAPLESTNADQPADEKVERILVADSPRKLARAYRELFSAATEEQLRHLVAHPKDVVALAAAWERVRRTLPKEEQEELVHPDALALDRFLGLVEGRTQLRLPHLWEVSIQAASSYGRDRIGFPWPEGWGVDLYPRDAVAQPKKAEAPSVREVPDGFQVFIGGDVWLLPRVRNLAFVSKASVELTDAQSFVALYDLLAVPYALYAVDRSTGEIVWKTRVWAEGDLGGAKLGLGWHQAELRVRDNKLLVFGVATNVVYIEIFDVETGENLCRFSSSYAEYANR